MLEASQASSAEVEENYKAAITKLNALQSNAEVLRQARESRHQMQGQNVQETVKCLQIIGISLDEIDQLNCIHITGTKGKGSTAAFVESILRKQGFKTGFYSSPHLVSVCERIRINGRPIPKQKFLEHFSKVYDKLSSELKTAQMPGYFKFLTLIAFHVFLIEQVNVAIIEVGIGGEHDCTNAIKRPLVCAITTLDFDHTRLLGSTLPEIAWQKAGIAKAGSILLSVPQSSVEATSVIRQRCDEKKCSFYIIPDQLSAYNWPKPISELKFGISGKHQLSNISLALQITSVWLAKYKHSQWHEDPLQCKPCSANLVLDWTDKELLQGFEVSTEVLEALESCRWPGRSQHILRNNINFFLDGAHTPQSMQFCAEWFLDASNNAIINNQAQRSQFSNSGAVPIKPFRILIFHCTGDRDSATLLQKLLICDIDIALFCPARMSSPPSTDKKLSSNDNANFMIDADHDQKRCIKDRQEWNDLNGGRSLSIAFQSIDEALKYAEDLFLNNRGGACTRTKQVHVLITGSLHLVGSSLSILDPEN